MKNPIRSHAISATALALAILAFSARGLPLYAQKTPSPSPLSTPAPARAAVSPPAPAAARAAPPEASPGPAKAAPPASFQAYSLGMGVEEVKAALASDQLLEYRETDVSLLPDSGETLIEVFGLGFIRRATFQFSGDKLYVMIFALNEEKVDYYSVCQSFEKKYGAPSSVSPSEIFWGDDKTKVSVERPLSVKYMDMAERQKLLDESGAKKSFREIDRQDFLDSF